MASTTKLSVDKLRKEGYLCQLVEKWNPFARVRQDLFGFIDIVAIKDRETLGVQATVLGEISRRKTKINDSPYYLQVKKAGWKIEVHGWKKKKNRWECRVVEL